MLQNRFIPKEETPEQRMARLDREASFAYRARRFHTSASQRLNNYKEDNNFKPPAPLTVAPETSS